MLPFKCNYKKIERKEETRTDDCENRRNTATDNDREMIEKTVGRSERQYIEYKNVRTNSTMNRRDTRAGDKREQEEATEQMIDQ